MSARGRPVGDAKVKRVLHIVVPRKGFRLRPQNRRRNVQIRKARIAQKKRLVNTGKPRRVEAQRKKRSTKKVSKVEQKTKSRRLYTMRTKAQLESNRTHLTQKQLQRLKDQ